MKKEIRQENFDTYEEYVQACYQARLDSRLRMQTYVNIFMCLCAALSLSMFVATIILVIKKLFF